MPLRQSVTPASAGQTIPASHGPPSHGGAPCQVPAEPQVWTPPSEQCTAPGGHTPVQAPLTHAWFTQGIGTPQEQVEVGHVCTALPEHCVAPGEGHEHVHAP